MQSRKRKQILKCFKASEKHHWSDIECQDGFPAGQIVLWFVSRVSAEADNQQIKSATLSKMTLIFKMKSDYRPVTYEFYVLKAGGRK